MAYGATIQAGILSGESSQKFDDFLLLDITALSLGTDRQRPGGELEMSNIVNRNTAIPIKKTERYTTVADN